MHEVSIISSLLELVREEMARHKVRKLLLVRISYGPFNNIVPDALSFAFQALTENTDLEGAILEQEKLPLTLRCSSCDEIFTPPQEAPFLAACPHCGAAGGHRPEGGDELFLQHIEAE